MPLTIGIDEVGCRHRLHRHHRLPFGEILRLVQPVILFDLRHFTNASMADGKRALFVQDHHAVPAAIDGARHRQHQRAELHPQPDAFRFQRQPFAVEAILGAVVIQDQLVNIDQIRPVDRVGPAQILVVAQKRERRAGEVGAGEIPAFIRMHHQFPPGHAACPRLVAVDDQAGGGVA